MEVRFANKDLDRLETDPRFDGAYPQEVVRKFRLRMQFIRGAKDEQDFYALKSLHYEKLKGGRSHERSMRLNQQWRLILAIERRRDQKVVVVIAIEDYH